ncbi:MAG: hypothetical protein E7312_03265 [Clostridiales bacterium]|nr:hypothetical protein [Clostridiales bacterium]
MTILNKQPNKDFIILNLSDPQLNNEDWEDKSLNKDILINTVNTLIKRVSPDLITVTGDLAEFNCIQSLYNFTEFIDSFNIPWACVLGNHDNEFDTSVLLDAICTKKNSLFEQGDPNMGCGNYAIAIKEAETVVTALFMMDTHDNIPGTKPNGEPFMPWGRLIPSQIEWYSNTVNELKQKGCLDAAVFVHIPIYAYREAMKSAYNTNQKPFLSTTVEDSYGTECWNEGYEDSFGVCWNEWVDSSETDDKMLDAMLDSGITKHIVCGHDHDNNFVIKHKGVKFIYSTKTGAGHAWYPPLNGGTVLTVGKNGITNVKHEYVKDYIKEK